MKTATNLNSATGSVLGLAELIGISHGKMRTLIGHLCAAGLITSESSNKGTAFRLTDRGEQVLNFTSADVDDFSTILSVIQRPWKSHATLTLLATQDLPTFGYNMIDPLKSWCWGSILFYPFKISRFS